MLEMGSSGKITNTDEVESIHIDDVLKMVRLKDYKQIGNTIMKALEAAFEMESKK